MVDGTLSVGELVAFQSLMLSFSAPIAQMVGTAAKVQQASADIARLDDVLHYRRDWRFTEEPARSRLSPPAACQLTGL